MLEMIAIMVGLLIVFDAVYHLVIYWYLKSIRIK